MDERFEFRIDGELADQCLDPGVGRVYGDEWDSVRRVLARRGDGIFERIGELDAQRRRTGGAFFSSWSATRSFTKAEWESAVAVRWDVLRTFEPAGTSAGTDYDFSEACAWCDRGRRRRTALRLDPRSLPRGKIDAARTIGGEFVVSQRFRDLWTKSRFFGARMDALEDQGGVPIDGWYSLEATSVVEVASPPTLFGDDPWDPRDGRELCPLRHVGGRNVLTQLTVRDHPVADLSATDLAIGQRSGDLVPEPMLVLSKRAFELVEPSGLKLGTFEVARVLTH